MKKYFYLTVLLLGAISMPSCNNDEPIWDYAPVILKVNVVNQQGDNLLDSQYNGNILDGLMTLTYNGKTSGVALTPPEDLIPQSRYYLPTWYGAFVMSGENYWTYPEPTEPAIFIGEFDGSASGKFDMTLTLGDKSFELSFTSKVNKGDVKREFFIDGKKNSNNNLYTITL